MDKEITLCSLEQLKNQTGINRKKATTYIKKAIQRGKGAESFTSWERRYLKDGVSNGYRAVAYDGYCYIISSDGVCVTLYPLPRWFGKKKRFDGKEKIRNVKKYCHLGYDEKEYIRDFV
jgi:hypothetical protein